MLFKVYFGKKSILSSAFKVCLKKGPFHPVLFKVYFGSPSYTLLLKVYFVKRYILSSAFKACLGSIFHFVLFKAYILEKDQFYLVLTAF